MSVPFIWLTARVLEQRRFEHLFLSGTPEVPLAALLAYRLPDGGFGYGLESDGVVPIAHPSIEPYGLIANQSADGV